MFPDTSPALTWRGKIAVVTHNLLSVLHTAFQSLTPSLQDRGVGLPQSVEHSAHASGPSLSGQGKI